jgi:outer membrane receptor protein involved in Fe transport
MRSASASLLPIIISSCLGAAAAGLPVSIVRAAQTAAPQAASGAGTLEEVIVTAGKRSQSLQDVPMSITALTEQAIERAGIVDFLDYATKVPNLTFASGHGILDAQTIAVRGIQGADTTGFYIDDLPVPATLNPRVIDLERIEVLRGPQGTLYGARSMGGTVRLITQPPQLQDFSARLHAMGSHIERGGGGYQIDGSVNIPLVADRAAMRVTAFGGNDGSFIERVFPTPGNPGTSTHVQVARKDFAGGMVSVLWKPTENLTIRPTLLTEYSKLNGWPLADATADNLNQVRPFDIAEPARDKWTYGGVTMTYATPIADVISASSWLSRQAFENEDYSQQLTGILSTPLLPASFPTWQPRHSFVEELRFSSRFSGPLQFVGGVFLQRSSDNYNQYSNVPGLDASAAGQLGTDLVFAEQDLTRHREEAAFGELTYQFAQRWSATLGLRYSRIETDFERTLAGIAAAGITGGRGSQKEHRLTPKIAVKYEPDADTTYYALASNGFRPGSAQTPPPPSFCASDYAASGVTPQDIAQYKADSLWNYEIGTKGRLLDRRLSVSAAAYWINWTDVQQTVLFSCGYPYIVNAGKARSRGAELEMASSPLDGLTISVGVGYTDAKITQSAPLAGTRAGDPIQQIAPWTVSASVDYSFPVTGRWRGLLHADNGFVDRSFSANNDPANPRLRPAYDLANLRLGGTTDALEITGFINNISNTHANLGDNQSQAAELPGRPRLLVNPPRTYGLSMTLRW